MENRCYSCAADDAAVWYREYLRRSPAGPQARQSLFRLGESAYLSGRNEAAGRELRRFVQQYPDDGLNAFVLAYLGEVALVQADLLAAERDFRQCLKRFPEGRMQDDCRLGLRGPRRNREIRTAPSVYT